MERIGLWTKKYRPKTFNDIIGQEHIIESIKSMIPDIPHMLFKGPPGTGKTTMAEIIARELGLANDFKEMNASDERGIAVVQNKIKNFAKNAGFEGSFRLILLDEADALTPDAQNALRRIMEQYESNCRFILTCNYPQKITGAITSRCQGGIFEFLPPDFNTFKSGILKILDKENVTITNEALEELYKKSESKGRGDLRVIDKLYNISAMTRSITIEHVNKYKEDNTYLKVFIHIKNGKYMNACKLIEKQHIIPLFDMIHNSQEIPDELKGKLVDVFAEWDKRDKLGTTEYIQLYRLIYKSIKILKGS